jgi:drug/metabolite transporter (DMT)-like permease
LSTIKSRTVKSDLLLLLASAIWGFAFVAQRKGMEFIGPFTFNGIRFALGSLWLIPFLSQKRSGSVPATELQTSVKMNPVFAGILLGIILFGGASLQQIGIIYTTAGKAGFITGLYVIIVPVFGIFLKKPSKPITWIAAVLATIGLYFLSVKGDFSISKGDLLVLLSAFFWAGHVQFIDWLVNRYQPLLLAFLQFITCSVLSLLAAFYFETIDLSLIWKAVIPILYAGLLSVGMGYTLQLLGQREAHPSHAAIILSLESVFAVLGGFVLLNEFMQFREILGCSLMLCAMILSQIRLKKSRRVLFNETRV